MSHNIAVLSSPSSRQPELHAPSVLQSVPQPHSSANLFPDHFGPYTAAVNALCVQFEKDVVERERNGGSALEQRLQLRGSGLLKLAIPTRYGGLGERWPLIYRMIRRLSEADSSLGHLFGFQHLQIASLLLFANAEQQQYYLGRSAAQNWFWGNATNILGPQVSLTDIGGHYVLDGLKTFCSGSVDADALNVSAPDPHNPGGRVIIVLPANRPGIAVLDDWDAFGQRQSDSGSVRFTQVHVDYNEVLGPPGASGTPRATLRPCVSQLILTEIYLGNAQGALRSAWHYTRTVARAWVHSGVAQATDDPFIQQRYGALWLQFKAAVGLAEAAAQTLQKIWDLGDAVTAADRGEAALAIAEARVFAARTALEITSQIFETMGARATASRYGFDRYWRNVRTHTLHDPLDYKLRDLGRWVLSGEPPVPSIYA